MTADWRQRRGAIPVDARVTRFSVWAPRAGSVGVELVGTDGGGLHEMSRDAASGEFVVEIEGVPPGTDYRFLLDGRERRPDPTSRHQPVGVHGPSRVVDPRAHPWSDAGWRGVRRADIVLYELHVGTFSREGTFAGVVSHLDGLRDLGVTAVELMPVAQFPGARNWGYDGVFPYAPQCTYGGPEGLRSLVDAAHARGIAVVLDVVYNHLGPEGNVLDDFGPYFTNHYRTPWGAALNFDGPDSDEVRRFFIENALMWLDEYHLDGLRLDAVHGIHDMTPRPFLLELREAVDELSGVAGRPLHLFAESDLNDPRLVRSPAKNGIGLAAAWSDDFHHSIHAALTGERGGYYADYGPVASIRKVYTDRFVYDGCRSPYRRRRQGAPATDLSSDRFVVFVQNHDQIGNRAQGDRLAALVPPARTRLAAATLLLSPYLPLLFMGEEYGETAPFLYFVDHSDEDLLDAVRRGRQEEFAAFSWGEGVPDPAHEDTHTRSTIDRRREASGAGQGIESLYRTLLQLRREHLVLRPGRAELETFGPEDAAWFGVVYRPRDAADAGAIASAVALFNFGEDSVEIVLPEATAGFLLVLDTEETRFGGAGAEARLGPWSARLYVEGGRS